MLLPTLSVLLQTYEDVTDSATDKNPSSSNLNLLVILDARLWWCYINWLKNNRKWNKNSKIFAYV